MTKEQIKQLMKALGQDCYDEGEDYITFDGYWMTDEDVTFYFNEKGELIGIGGN